MVQLTVERKRSIGCSAVHDEAVDGTYHVEDQMLEDQGAHENTGISFRNARSATNDSR